MIPRSFNDNNSCYNDLNLSKKVKIDEEYSDVLVGKIKNICADFIVREIDPNGNILHVNPNFDVKEEKIKKDCSSDMAINQIDDIKSSELIALIGIEEYDKIKSMKKNDEHSFILNNDCDKNQRTSIHKLIKTLYPQFTTQTVEPNDKCPFKSISVFNKSKDTRNSQSYYSYFTLYKENKTTNDALFYLTKYLNIKFNRLSFAGTKDKKAITTQRVSCYCIPSARLYSLNNILIKHKIYIDNVSENKKDQITLGCLNGNSFEIVVRAIDFNKNNDEVAHSNNPVMNSINSLSFEDKYKMIGRNIEKQINHINHNGFINYFGKQRFGTDNLNSSTSTIGKQILMEKYKEAVNMILSPAGKSDQKLINALSIWHQTKSPNQVLENVDKKLLSSPEILIIKSLCENETDYLGAILKLPRNLRLLYVHSYQSYLWNMVAKRRYELYGYKVLDDDLTMNDTKCFETQQDLNENWVQSSSSDTTAGSLSIFDVVIPIPGTRTMSDAYLTNNSMGKLFLQIFISENIDLNFFNHPHKDFSLTGNYRKYLSKASGMFHELFKYNESYPLPVLATDLKTLEFSSAHHQYDFLEVNSIGCILKFQLESSNYATVLLDNLFLIKNSHYEQTE